MLPKSYYIDSKPLHAVEYLRKKAKQKCIKWLGIWISIYSISILIYLYCINVLWG